MAKKFQLNIPEPCHEDWDAMTPVEKGKFCGSCQKQVVDFSGMSDRQIAEFFKKPSTGSVCGRFMNDQLDRDIEIQKKRIPWLRYFFSMALPAFLMSLKSFAAKTQGQVKEKRVLADTTHNPVYPELHVLGTISSPQKIWPVARDTFDTPGSKPICTEKVMGKPSVEVSRVATYPEHEADSVFINGSVMNDSNQPLGAVEVLVKGNNRRTVTNASGEFAIWVLKGETLVVTCNDYGVTEQTIMGDQPVKIVLHREVVVATAGRVVVQRDDVSTIKLQIENESKEPIAFASIELDGKNFVMADDQGFVEMRGKRIKNFRQIRISAAGYLSQEILSANCNKKGLVQLITLKTGQPLPEVVVQNSYALGVVRRTVGMVMKGTEVRVLDQPKDEQQIAGTDQGLKIYPVPALPGSMINLAWKSQVEGSYQIQLYSLAGQLIKREERNPDREARMFTYSLPNLAAGTYIIMVISEKSGEKRSAKMIIQ